MDVRQGFQVAPGKCFTCSNGDPKLWVIDTGADDPSVVKRHRVYICAPCILAAAKSLEPHTGVKLVSDDALAVMHASSQQADEWLQRAEAAEARLAEIAGFVAGGAI